MRDFFREELEALRKRSLDRHLREISSAQGPEVEIAGRRFINFSSNDYLGLANDPTITRSSDCRDSTNLVSAPGRRG